MEIVIKSELNQWFRFILAVRKMLTGTENFMKSKGKKGIRKVFRIPTIHLLWKKVKKIILCVKKIGQLRTISWDIRQTFGKRKFIKILKKGGKTEFFWNTHDKRSWFGIVLKY